MRKIEIMVGFFAAISLAALFILAMKMSSFSNVGSSNNYSVKANFDEIGGLKIKAPVTIAGVRVGRVKNIQLSSADYTAEVTIALDSDLLPMQKHDGDFGAIFSSKTGLAETCLVGSKDCATPLFEDATASILTSGLLGAQYIGISPGGGSPNLLAQNGFIAITQSAVGLEQVIGQLLFSGGGDDDKSKDKPAETISGNQ